MWHLVSSEHTKLKRINNSTRRIFARKQGTIGQIISYDIIVYMYLPSEKYITTTVSAIYSIPKHIKIKHKTFEFNQKVPKI